MIGWLTSIISSLFSISLVHFNGLSESNRLAQGNYKQKQIKKPTYCMGGQKEGSRKICLSDTFTPLKCELLGTDKFFMDADSQTRWKRQNSTKGEVRPFDPQPYLDARGISQHPRSRTAFTHNSASNPYYFLTSGTLNKQTIHLCGPQKTVSSSGYLAGYPQVNIRQECVPEVCLFLRRNEAIDLQVSPTN